MKSGTLKALLLSGAAAALAAAAPAAAQTPAKAAATASVYKAPRTAHGHPDLQGIWTNATITPFERPKELGERLILTPQEAAKLEAENAALNAEGNKPTDPSVRTEDLPKECGRGFVGANCGYNSFWVDPGTQVITINGQARSSMLVEPANGRLPELTPEGKKRMAERMKLRAGGAAFSDPEVRALGERCILSFGSSAGPPMIPLLYNNNYQIVQTGDEVAILVEMVHDVRIIRLNGQHAPSHVRTWMGDSIGRWEGDTLVIETTNFRPEQSFRGASDNLKVTERLTRVAPDKILYRFKVEDPSTFTAPFSGEIAMNASKGPIYEYACHEGNYSLPGILAGARADEAAGRVPSQSGLPDEGESRPGAASGQ